MSLIVPWLAKALVFAGIVLLGRSLLVVRRLVDRLPNGAPRRRWAALAAMIVLFMIGYAAYAALRWEAHHTTLDLIVPAIFFLGACFVVLTATLSLQTAMDLVRMGLLEREAWTDPLTGIFNRRYMDQRLAEAVAASRRYPVPLAVLLLDIDHFKDINDRHGHIVGDQVLVSIGRALSAALRDSDVLARYGGEEFLVIATHTDAVRAAEVAERLRQGLAAQALDVRDGDGQPLAIHLTVSIGVASFCSGADTMERLVRLADENLYRAKRAGRNRVVADPPSP